VTERISPVRQQQESKGVKPVSPALPVKELETLAGISHRLEVVVGKERVF